MKAGEVTWDSLLTYFEVMSALSLVHTEGNVVAVACNAFLAGLVIAQNDSELADAIRHAMEGRMAEEMGVTAEQVEVAIREAFNG